MTEQRSLLHTHPFFLVSVDIVCPCECLFPYVWMPGTCIYVCRGQKLTLLSIFLHHSPLHFLRLGLSQNPNLADSTSLPSQLTWGIPCLHLSTTGFVDGPLYLPTFVWLLGIKTLNLHLHNCFSPLSLVPSPQPQSHFLVASKSHFSWSRAQPKLP